MRSQAITAGTDSDDGENGDFVHRAQHGRHQGRRAGDGQGPTLDGRTTQADQRVQHDGDHHGLDPMQQRRCLRQSSEPLIGPSDRRDDEECGQDERNSRDDEPGEASAGATHVDRDFRRVGTGDEIRGADEIEELIRAQPAAASRRARPPSGRCAPQVRRSQ